MTDKYDPKLMAADNPLGFVGVPSDLDGVLLLLACNQASRYVTGVTIAVDGGISWGG
jgi:NAD(P)-dependent dehydrogenase (short-subunit alcohol dehydrogenase family)